MARERLQSYSIHEKPMPATDRIARAEGLEFVKDGFVGAAFVLPPWWLARRGVWMGVLTYIGAAAAILALEAWFEWPRIVTLLAFVGLHLFFAGEADEMYRARLAARGWTMIAQVIGISRLDCERRFLDQWLGTVPVMSSPAKAQATPPVPPRSRAPASVLGNLLAPLRRARQ